MKKTIAILMFLVLVLTVSGCGSSGEGSAPPASPGAPASSTAPASSAAPASSEAPAGASIVIKFGHNGSTDPKDPQNVAAYAFEEMMEERSGGDIDVQIYPAAQLGDARTMVEGIQMGTLEMADIENGPMGGFVPQSMVWDLPYLYKDLDHAHRVAQGEVGKQLKELFLEKNIRVLDFNDGGFRYFTNSKRPINSPEDMKGLKIRVMESEVMIASVNAFGATAVPMAFGEVYTALQQGTVDGQENPFNLIYSQKYFEVQKYLSLTEHFYYPRHYLISEIFYKTLPDDHKKLVEACAIEACAIQRQALLDYDEELTDLLTGEGMEINEVDKEAFMAVSQAIYPQFYKAVGGGDEETGKALIEAVMNA